MERTDDPEAKAKWAAYMREYTRKNRDRINAQRRVRRATAAPERRAEIQRLNRERDRKWRERDPDHARALSAARQRALYQRDPKRAYATIRRYVKANPAQAAAWRQARRARKQKAPGTATVEQIMGRVAFFGGLCWMCGKSADTLDHVKPLAHGGSNWPANLRPACGSCNSRKGHRRESLRRPSLKRR